MPQTDTIAVNEFCIHHNIELSFIYSLKEEGLIELIQQDEMIFVPVSELPRLEKMVRLYYQMDINIAGIETITHLLQRMEQLQQQVVQLNNRLMGYRG